MRKDNRKHYLQIWLTVLKGKTEIDYQDLAKAAGKEIITPKGE